MQKIILTITVLVVCHCLLEAEAIHTHAHETPSISLVDDNHEGPHNHIDRISVQAKTACIDVDSELDDKADKIEITKQTSERMHLELFDAKKCTPTPNEPKNEATDISADVKIMIVNLRSLEMNDKVSSIRYTLS